MNAPLRIGLAGYGYWGPNLARNFAAIDGAAVAAVCDPAPGRRAEAAQRHPGAAVFDDFGAMLGSAALDAVAIATPTALHYPLAMAALDAGKHVFVEKPLADTLDRGRAMVARAAAAGRTLMVGHTFIYSSPVREIKRILRSGEIGEIIYCSAQRLNLGLFQKDINVVWDLAPHDISILLYLLGEPPVSVNCQGKAHFVPGIEDVATVSMHFAGGAFATVHTSWLDPNKVRLINVVGTKKMIRYDDNEPLEKIKVYDKGVEPAAYYDGLGEFQYAYHYGDMYAPYFKQAEPLRVECQHFADCVRSGAPPESGGPEGLAVLQVLEDANRSLRRGGARVAFRKVV